MKNSGELLVEPLVSTQHSGRKQPFVLHNNRLYFQRYFAYETRIFTRLQEFIESEKQIEIERLKSLHQEGAFIKELFKPRTGSTVQNKTDWQLEVTCQRYCKLQFILSVL